MLFDLLLVLLLELADQHLVVGLATVFEQNHEYLPDSALETVFVWRVAQRLLEHLVETHGVDEQSSVDPVCCGAIDFTLSQLIPVNAVSVQRLFAFRLQNYSRNLEVAGINKSIVDPCFDDSAIQTRPHYF